MLNFSWENIYPYCISHSSTLKHGSCWNSHCIQSILWQLMTRRCKRPRHQQTQFRSILQIPQCMCTYVHISDQSHKTHNACAHVCTFLAQNGVLWGICLMHYGILWDGSIDPIFEEDSSLNTNLLSQTVLVSAPEVLTHWGQVMNICIGNLTTTGSDNGLSPGRRQAIISTNVGILLIRKSGKKFSEILSEIYTFSFKKMHLEMLSGKWCPFCLSLNVLTAMAMTS